MRWRSTSETIQRWWLVKKASPAIRRALIRSRASVVKAVSISVSLLVDRF
jgi:hypothetical protein